MTAAIAVVTRRTGLLSTVTASSRPCTEIRPEPGWLARPWTEQVVVLDLETAQATLEALDSLTAAGAGPAFVVVAGDSEGWDELLSRYPDLSLVSLPAAQESLLPAVDRAVRGSAVPTALVPEEAVANGAVAAEVPKPTPRPRPHRRVDETVPDVEADADEEPPETPPPPVAPARPVAGSRTDPHERLMEMVRILRRQVSRLDSVPEVAEAVRRQCVTAVPSGASAVLVPDGDVWRVSAGEHLRPLEERLQVPATHWLVTEVASAHHGLRITDTDIARSRLIGAPLASWRNLLALPVGDTGAVVMLARDDHEFAAGDVGAALAAATEATQLLRDAVSVRDLAREMTYFLDAVD